MAVDASDGKLTSNRLEAAFKLTVKAPPGYPPTVIRGIPDQTVDLDESIEVPVWSAFDTPKGYRVIRYDFVTDDIEVTEDSEISRDGVLTLNGAEEGNSWVSVRACNTLGCTQFRDLSFVVVVSDPDKEENREPEVIGFVTNRSLKVGESVTLDVSAAFDDPDDDPIVRYEYILESTKVARGSSISDTGMLRLQASAEGTTTVSIVACDEEDCSDPDDMRFILTVKAPG